MREPPPTASLDAVAEFAAGLQETFLFCRDEGHSWDRKTSAVSRVGDRLYQSMDCQYCETMRVRIFDTSTMEYVGSRYQYPQDYRSPGLGRLDRSGRSTLRREKFRRMGVL